MKFQLERNDLALRQRHDGDFDPGLKTFGVSNSGLEVAAAGAKVVELTTRSIERGRDLSGNRIDRELGRVVVSLGRDGEGQKVAENVRLSTFL